MQSPASNTTTKGGKRNHNYAGPLGLTISPAYRMVHELYSKPYTVAVDETEGSVNPDTDWFLEYRPNLNVSKSWKIPTPAGKISVKDRVRFSYRSFDIDKDSVWRIRNKLGIKSPWKWTNLEVNPYIEDEIFWEQNDEVDALQCELLTDIDRRIEQHDNDIRSLLRVRSVFGTIERIADHATNIAEDVIYMIQGDIVRHRTEG